MRPAFRPFFMALLTCAALAQGYAPGDKVIFDYLGDIKEGEILKHDKAWFSARAEGAGTGLSPSIDCPSRPTEAPNGLRWPN